uniref:Ground-like domain-containing protein n=1 Tax=Caenorhabditis tropicalis TaxID=1561998 RepID=A0A1I7V0B5_9PELO
MQAMNLMAATTEPRRAIPKQADGTDCPMPPECGCLCGRSGGRKKRNTSEFWKQSEEPESEIRCTSGKLRRVVEKAIAKAENDGIQFDIGVNTLQNYVLFCQAEVTLSNNSLSESFCFRNSKVFNSQLIPLNTVKYHVDL